MGCFSFLCKESGKAALSTSFDGSLAQRGYTHCIPPDTNMVEVDLEVTNITLKKEK